MTRPAPHEQTCDRDQNRGRNRVNRSNVRGYNRIGEAEVCQWLRLDPTKDDGVRADRTCAGAHVNQERIANRSLRGSL